MAAVSLENVYKTYSRNPASRSHGITGTGTSTGTGTGTSTGNVVLRAINLSVADGEFMVLVGPSGCGKSTLLRLISGLEEITAGTVRVGDQVVNDLPPKDRDIAMVFQSYALYPHLTVYDNLAFGLRRSRATTPAKTGAPLPAWAETFLVEASRKLPPALRYQSQREQDIASQVQAVAQMLQIESLLDRLPKQLSGGQKQRVALGRAMARNPQVFLMDEPLSNLDAKLRAETRTQIVQLQRRLGTTTLYVTHDQTEAMTMGDRIAVLNAGQIQQIATPLELYNHPANRFVAEFIGTPPMNLIPVQVKSPLTLLHPQFRLTLPSEWESLLRSYEGHMLLLGVRPEHLKVSAPATKNLAVQVQVVEALGNETLVSADFDRLPLQVRLPPDLPVQVGEDLWLALLLDKIHLFDQESGQALRLG